MLIPRRRSNTFLPMSALKSKQIKYAKYDTCLRENRGKNSYTTPNESWKSGIMFDLHYVTCSCIESIDINLVSAILFCQIVVNDWSRSS